MFRNLWARIKATPPWVWITIAIAAAGLVISWLIYRNSASNGVSTASTTGGVSPQDYNGSSIPGTGGGSSGAGSSYSDSAIADLLAQILAAVRSGGSGTTPPPPAPPGGLQPMPGVNPGGITNTGISGILSGSIAHSDTFKSTTPHPTGGPVPAHLFTFQPPTQSGRGIMQGPPPGGPGTGANAPTANAPGGAGPMRQPFPIRG